tara:strand:- start:88 stop:672 length:585 start_codon:yes stop_codon:yes gene_type:complete
MGKTSRRQRRQNPKIVKENPVNYKRIDGTPAGNFQTGWSSWEDCLAFCKENYPHIPVDMIELAMGYCERHPDTKEKWETIPSVNLPLSGKMRRKLEKDGTLEDFLAKQKTHDDERHENDVIENAVKVYNNPDEAPKFPLGKGVPVQDSLVHDGTSGVGFIYKGKIWSPNQDGYEGAKDLYEKDQKKISLNNINE